MSQQDHVGGFELREKIGAGGMATVYMARQTALDRLVVVKIMHAHLTEDKGLVERFMHEARSAAALRHPNIVQVIDCGETDSTPYIAMEFVDGRDLKQFIVSHGIPPLEVSLLLLRDICLGLEHAHVTGVVHRDIKPGNIMLTSDGMIKIMDFGLARREEETAQMTIPGSVMGTPAYMSPEQAEGKTVSDRTDLFSLGIMAYELMCGTRPFQGESYAQVINSIIQHQPVPLADPPVPPALSTLIQQLLIKDPPSRRPSAATVRELLEPLIQKFKLEGTTSLLQEYARDPDACKQRLAAIRAKTVPEAVFESTETIVLMPDTTEPPRPADRPPEKQEQTPEPAKPMPPITADTPVPRKNLVPVVLVMLAVTVTIVLLLVIQPWKSGDDPLPAADRQSAATEPANDLVGIDSTLLVTGSEEDVSGDDGATDPAPIDSTEAGNTTPIQADVSTEDPIAEPVERQQLEQSPPADMPFGIICFPAGRIMYKNVCLNADGFWHSINLKPGPHRFEVIPSGSPNEIIPFEYIVRGDEPYNKLLLNLESGMVEVNVTDLSSWEFLSVDE
jgi:eukaryotic-like serine/threonine-protein kinase